MSDAEERDRLARALSDHEIGRVIGRGQFGVVWSARHIHLSRDVAVKWLDEQIALDAEHSARFRREARTLARLDHKHVVAVHDYREVDGMRLLVMEVLAGGTLADRRASATPVETAVAATLAAVCGLHHVHVSGVLHRYIKPENLMFDTAGVLKVTDFGLARGDSQVETSVELSRVGTFFGTPAYVAPEQAAAALAEGWPDVGQAADQYSLAAVLYESISGQLTHDATGGGIAPCTRRMNEPARPLVALSPGTPAAVSTVVMRALSRDPAERYPSTEEFAVELASAANASLGSGWLDRSAVGIREPGPVLDEATGHHGVAPRSGGGNVPREPLPAPPAATGSRSLLATLAVLAVLLAGIGATWFLTRDDTTADVTVAPTQAPFAPDELPLELTETWATPTGDNVFASPVLAGDTLVVGSEDSSLYGLARTTGEVLWTYGTGAPIISTAAIEGDTVVVGSREDGVVHAVGLDGAAKWTTNLDFGISASPSIANGIVVVGADRLHALDLATGEPRWDHPTNGDVIASPLIVDDAVVVGSNGGDLTTVGLNDGQERWTIDLGSPIRSSPAVGGDTVFVATMGGSLHAISVSNGEEQWRIELASELKSSPLVTEGLVIIGTDDGRLVAVDRGSGDQVWTWEGTRAVDSSPALGDGWVAVGSNDNSLHLIDVSSGEEVGRFSAGGPVLSSPLVAEDQIFVGSHDDRVYALTVGSRP